MKIKAQIKMENTWRYFCLLILAVLLNCPVQAEESKLTEAQLEYFENHIRPVLVKHCYECHNSGDESESDVALDFRDAFRKGGEQGPLVNLKQPEESLLLKILRHEVEDLEMPMGGEKLGDETIAHFEQWLKMGAPDPRDSPPSQEEINQAASWEAIREKRKEWWSFQPLREYPVPEVSFDSWSDHPVDRFIAKKLKEKNLSPSETASRHKLIRRLSYVLTGLPPSHEEINEFLDDSSPQAYEKLVDRYLASEQFGERWARHWMDWVRYTNTHGSEGDPAIPYSYQYRDYLIRALNQDIPYDQLVREHVAGDLLKNPRLNEELGINESALGIAHWRMVFHGFSPTDPLDEKVRFTDDQINVFSKAFLGLTVSCARCHNHKFDAISQTDYYALFGILGSTRPATVDVSLPEKQNLHKEELRQLKKEIRSQIADLWMESADSFAEQLINPSLELGKSINQSENKTDLFLLMKTALDQTDSPESAPDKLNDWLKHWQKSEKDRQHYKNKDYFLRWKMTSEEDQKQWFRDGNGMEDHASPAGEFHLNEKGDQVLSGIYPGGIYSHLLSDKHRGIIHSPRFFLDDEYDVWFRTAGENNAMNRYVVQNYPRSGTIYPVGRLNDINWKWRKFKLAYWKGDHAHLEISTAADQALLVTDQDRSWFGVRDVIVCKKTEFGADAFLMEHLNSLYEKVQTSEVSTPEEMAQIYEDVLKEIIGNWKNDRMTDEQSLLLDTFLRAGLLPNQLSKMKTVEEAVNRYRKLESEIPVPTRSPGLLEADNFDQPLMERGNHKNLKDPVPRRFLESIDPEPYQPVDSGRIELADDLFRNDNPFTARVIVNRLWHYVFGHGIVRTTDNFGRLGSQPTHPELLDYLAIKMKKDQWSLKNMIRFLVMTETFRQRSEGSKEANEIDPANEYLSHYNLRRLDAEAIRDSLLAVSGDLDSLKYGPGFPANSQSKRRSVYMKIRRNSLDEFLKVFDAPVPFSTTGRRDITNVPAQSLALLNSKNVIQISEDWVKNLFRKYPDLSDEDRIQIMFVEALGQSPSKEELQSSYQFVRDLKEQYERDHAELAALENQSRELNGRIEAILKPARDLVYEEKNITNYEVTSDQPIPDALWQFNGDPNDSIGTLHAQLRNNAKIEDGALILNGKGYAQTVPISRDVREKTLEAWVQLDTLEQGGGGVMTIQTLNGVIFDSIVYAERIAKRWYAGSNHSVRSNIFNGPDETEADQKPVHVVIAYDRDGTIRGYRNGVPYGTPMRKSALQPYMGTESQILFGLRHGSPDGNRLLKGKILEARLYFRALSEEEIRVSAKMNQTFVSEEEIMSHVSAEDQEKIQNYQTELKVISKQKFQYGSPEKKNQAWNDFAHTLFNLKKFIYID